MTITVPSTWLPRTPADYRVALEPPAYLSVDPFAAARRRFEERRALDARRGADGPSEGGLLPERTRQ